MIPRLLRKFLTMKSESERNGRRIPDGRRRELQNNLISLEIKMVIIIIVIIMKIRRNSAIKNTITDTIKR